MTTSMSTAINGDGGYLVDPQTSDVIKSVLKSTASIRSIATVVNVEAFGWRLPMYLFPLDYLQLGGYALVAAFLYFQQDYNIYAGSREGMAAALEDGATDVIGLARPLVLDPAFSNRLLAGEDAVSAVAPIRTGIRAVDNAAMMEVSWYTLQLARIARGKAPLADAGGLSSLLKVAGLIGWRRLRMGRLRAS